MASRVYSRWQLWRLYWETLRYTRPSQLLHRVHRLLMRACVPAHVYVRDAGREPEVQWEAGFKFLAPVEQTVPTATHVARADAVLERRFTFLHQTVTYHDHVLWHDGRQSRLWRFHLHYFDYAVDLGRAFRTTGNPQYWSNFMTLTSAWIADNPPAQGDGWHPYTISLRLVNWMRAFFLFEQCFAAELSLRDRFLASLQSQARILRQNLEYDITGNHLIKNGRALVFAGAFFRGEEAAQWLRQGLRLLIEEAREQVLKDGGHYERSPLYHVQVLMDYLDVLTLIPEAWQEHTQLVAVVQRMMDFLRGILHPDGTLPLFNDCSLTSEPTPEAVLRYGHAVTATSATTGDGFPDVQGFVDSGYYVFRAADHFLILDCGPVCPDHLPPHAHCDLLSFELSVGGKRLITNSGTYQYEAGPWRDAFRGTAAHNTVQVDNEEQSAVWDSFRVGRRARVREVMVRQLERGIYFQGCYAGFEGNRLEHIRELFRLPGPCWVVVDTVARHKGREPRSVISRLHLPPQAEVAFKDDAAQLYRDGIHLQVLPLGGARFGREPGWFSPSLGVKEPSPCLFLRVQDRLPVQVGFMIAPGQMVIHVIGIEARQGGWRLQLRCEDQEYQLTSSDPMSC